MKLLSLITLFAVLNCLISQAVGQDPSKAEVTIQTINLDLINYSIKDFGLLPYDEAVRFVGTLPESLASGIKADKYFYLYYKEGRCPETYIGPDTSSVPDIGYKIIGSGGIARSNMFGKTTQLFLYAGLYDTNNHVLKYTYFAPNKKYCLQIIQDTLYANDLFTINGSTKILTPYSSAIKHYPYSVKINAHTASSTSDQIKLDFGLSYVPHVKTVFGIVSVHGYFTPINDNTDLKFMNDNHNHRWFWVRTSLFFCLAPITIVSGANQEIRSLGNIGNFGLGIGFRSPFYGYKFQRNGKVARQIFQPMRINIGFMHYAQTNPNPVIIKNTPRWSPMFSVTYNFGLAVLLGPLAKLFS